MLALILPKWVVYAVCSCCAVALESQIEQSLPDQPPTQAEQAVHLALGMDPWLHLRVHAWDVHLGPLQFSSQTQFTECVPILQLPWLLQPARSLQKGVPQDGPLQSSAHLHTLLTHSQSKQYFPLQSNADTQVAGGGVGITGFGVGAGCLSVWEEVGGDGIELFGFDADAGPGGLGLCILG